jgi:pectinesterase
MLASQDTIFTGPLPPKEIEKNGFIGPKQYAPRINGRHYYKDCFIRGDIDFIFGSATAYFENCELYSRDTGREINGYVTAASTPEGQEYGYVFEGCHFTGNCPPRSVYLGRPWRNFARVVLLHCRMEEHIRREGWHDWGKREAHDTLYFAEAGSTGPGAVPEERPEWVTLLNEDELTPYSRARVLGGKDGWMSGR